MLVPVLAYFTLGENDDGTDPPGQWRLFVLLCAVPCILSTLFAVRWVPESPHWLVYQGRNDKALEVLKQAAATNGLNVEEVFPLHVLVRPDDTPEVHSVMALLQPEWRNLTLKLWGTWFGAYIVICLYVYIFICFEFV